MDGLVHTGYYFFLNSFLFLVYHGVTQSLINHSQNLNLIRFDLLSAPCEAFI